MTDPQTLLTQAQCYACYGASREMLSLMRLALLRQWLLTITPGADTSAQALLAFAKCHFCSAATIYELKLMKLALLAQLASA